jgi:hypothetical protein
MRAFLVHKYNRKTLSVLLQVCYLHFYFTSFHSNKLHSAKLDGNKNVNTRPPTSLAHVNMQYQFLKNNHYKEISSA